MNEKMRIMIAYDGSECADAALGDLERAGLPREAEALVVSVAERWLPPPPSNYESMEASVARSAASANTNWSRSQAANALEALAEANALAAQAGKRVRERFASWSVLTEAYRGSPAGEMIRKADDWRPDLIIVGSEGRSRLGRCFLGSVSQKVVTEARCSVRVARGRAGGAYSPVRIVVGVDGSHAAEAAVSEVAKRVWPMGSEARVVTVDEPLVPKVIGKLIPPVVKWSEEQNKEGRLWVEQLVEAAARDLRKAELVVSTVIREGDPKRVLVDEADGWGADSIFVGSTGYGSVERFLLGSISAAVVTRAHCSVEVVRPKQAKRP